MEKPVTTLKQKLLLLFFGVFLGIIILELGLRAGGFLFTSLQDYSNRRSLREQHSYVIMCLGESTTALGGESSYPRQLERALDERLPEFNVSVVNRGVGGTTTTAILDQLEKNLDRYDPDVVITMMGINDRDGLIAYEDHGSRAQGRFIHRFRVYKLAELIWQSILFKFRNIPPPGWAGVSDGAAGYQRLAREYFARELYARAQSYYAKAIELSGGNPELYIGLGCCCMELEEYDEAEVYFRKALSAEPNSIVALINLGDSYGARGRMADLEKMYERARELGGGDVEFELEVAAGYRIWGLFDRAESICRKLLENDPDNFGAYYELGLNFQARENWARAEQMLRQAISLNPDDHRFYFALITCLMEQEEWESALEIGQTALQKNPDQYRIIMTLIDCCRELGKWDEAAVLAERMIESNPEDERALGIRAFLARREGQFNTAERYTDQARRLHNKPATVRNYRLLRDILHRKNIQLVCVQYPLREVDDLKAIFPESRDIIFVDNEEVFRQAIEEDKYDDYFSDVFAGNFGHCTPRGNRLLAGNVAAVLMEEYFSSR
jgi:tetratricopeptide (TPR) repeat protein